MRYVCVCVCVHHTESDAENCDFSFPFKPYVPSYTGLNESVLFSGDTPPLQLVSKMTHLLQPNQQASCPAFIVGSGNLSQLRRTEAPAFPKPGVEEARTFLPPHQVSCLGGKTVKTQRLTSPKSRSFRFRSPRPHPMTGSVQHPARFPASQEKSSYPQEPDAGGASEGP